MRLFLQKTLLLLPVLLIVAVLMLWPSDDARFSSLLGPEEPTLLPVPGRYLPQPLEFARHGHNAVALLITDTNSSWYGLVSGLSAIGVPVRVVASVEEALQHQVIFIYPLLSGATSTREDLQGLAAHVRSGGTLLAFGVLGGGLEELFGFAAVEERNLQLSLEFPDDVFTRPFIDTDNRINLGVIDDDTSGIPGLSFMTPKLPPLAVYADGSAAITRNVYQTDSGVGQAFAIGIDIGHFLLRARNARFSGLTDAYVNSYQPKVDTLLRLLAEVYRQGEPFPVLFSPTPAAKAVTILMTHDIDYTASIDNMQAYAGLEYEAGVAATYFIQTKYVTDFNDTLFFTAERYPQLQQLIRQGMEIASHSVSHSNQFRLMAAGTGTERYPEYQPFVRTFDQVENASITGELRVSRFLLEQLGGRPVQTFRPGHLSLPETLPQMLAATGYRYSSSMTANEALTHLPFRMMYDRGYAEPVAVFEFPVTIEDEQGRLGDRVDEAIALTRSIAAYRGLVNVLVHTDITDHKLEFVRDYIAAFRDTAWFGTVSGYGEWWAQRESVALQVAAPAADSRTLQLQVADSIAGLTLELPAGWQFSSGPAGTLQQGVLLSVGAFSGSTEISLRRE